MRLANLCWFFTILAHLQLTISANLRCYRGSTENYDVAPLASAESLLGSTCYNSSQPNAAYTFGFMGRVDSPETIAVLNALLERNDRNVFLVDWQKETSGITSWNFVGWRLSYDFQSIPNSVMVGLNLGEALSRMSDNGFDLSKTHLIGHSLGAHLIGNAGRYLKRGNTEGKTIDRITGLDPAGPWFEHPRILLPLGSECADFVDTIHTYPGYFSVQNSTMIAAGTHPLCSHNRAIELFIESLSSYHTLQASKASNYYEWEAIGNSTETVYIGDDMDRNARGNFYLTTNAESPYGKGSEGLYP